MLFFLAAVVVVAALAVGYWLGRRGRVEGPPAAPPAPDAPAVASPPLPAPITVAPVAVAPADGAVAERARLVRSYEAEAAALRRDGAMHDAELVQLRAFAADRRQQFDDLAQARAETARYRQIVVDLENNAPSLLFGPGAPDDLKLIVGVGPVLERMLHQLGVGTFRQIARWSERDIDDFDASLPEFPGRIRRDGWVTQARALHQSKYGETLPVRHA